MARAFPSAASLEEAARTSSLASSFPKKESDEMPFALAYLLKAPDPLDAAALDEEVEEAVFAAVEEALTNELEVELEEASLNEEELFLFELDIDDDFSKFAKASASSAAFFEATAAASAAFAASSESKSSNATADFAFVTAEAEADEPSFIPPSPPFLPARVAPPSLVILRPPRDEPATSATDPAAAEDDDA
jgi:hypothetical protein